MKRPLDRLEFAEERGKGSGVFSARKGDRQEICCAAGEKKRHAPLSLSRSEGGKEPVDSARGREGKAHHQSRFPPHLGRRE